MPAQKYPGAAAAALTTSGVNASDLLLNIDNSTGWPDGSTGKFVVVIEPGTDSAEKMLIASRAGLALTIDTRGYDGTAAVTHASGKTIRPSIDAASMQRWEDYVLTGHLPLAGGTLSGTLEGADQLFKRLLLRDYGEEVVAHGAMGTTETLDYSAANVHTGTLDENCTITVSNPTASGDCASMLVILTHDGSGGSTITWTNGTYVTADGEDPTLSTTAGAVLFFTLISVDGGTTWYVFYGGCTA